MVCSHGILMTRIVHQIALLAFWTRKKDLSKNTGKMMDAFFDP